MLRSIQIARVIAVLQVLSVVFTAIIFAQPDPTTVLIGRWEGNVEGVQSRNGGRTLLITSVKSDKEGSWVAEGRYGFTGRTLNPLTIDVSLQNGEIVLNFVSRNKDPIQLMRKEDGKLEGRLDTTRKNHSGLRLIGARLKLEKVEQRRKS